MTAPDLSVGSSPVWFGPVEQTLKAWLQAQTERYTHYFWVADANPYGHWQRTLPAVHPSTTYVLPVPDSAHIPGAAERLKTLTTCQHLWSAMLDATLDRRALVLAFGGGVVGDVGGFCAATYKRGVDIVQLPTTLLAMTDAALGGKVGIDFGGVKNALGAFHSPVAVFIDPTFLSSLPLREWRSGLAEVAKHAYIGAPALLERLRQNPHLLQAPHTASGDEWIAVLRSSVAVKAYIVEQDPYEGGLRALLNFGHTFGHALEAYFLSLGTPITHGEAIAVGMLCEWEAPTPSDLELLGPLLPLLPLSAEMWPHLWLLMQQDKKNVGGQVRIAVPGEEPFSLRSLLLTEEEARRRWVRCLRWLHAAQ